MVDFAGWFIAFDWNGTLVDDASRACASVNNVVSSRNLDTLSRQDFKVRFRLPLGEMFLALGVPEADVLAAEVEWNESMMALSKGPAGLRSEAVSVLTRFQREGARLAVVTAARADLVERDAGQETRRLFHDVRGGCTSKEHTLIELAAEAPTCRQFVFVGDTEHDIRAAVGAGWTAGGISSGYCFASALEVAGADFIIYAIEDLPLALETSLVG